MSTLKNVKTTCYIKKTKLLKSGKAPIYYRITIGNERAEFGIKRSILPEQWEAKNQRAKESATDAREINERIIQLENHVQGIVDYMKYEKEVPTAQFIKEKLIGKKRERRTILKTFNDHNKQARKLIGIDFAPATLQRYETSFKHTKDFIRLRYKRDDLALEEITQQFVRDYEIYLKTERHCNHNSTIKYLKNFKKITRIALANGWMQKDPFANIRFKLEKTDTIYLTQTEMDRIIEKQMPIERLAQVRDVFLFCCFTGLAFSDVKNLRAEHILEDQEGYTWIYKRREKSKEMCTIFLIQAAKQLLNKYADNPMLQEKGVLLPVLSNQKMNSYLKEIADICGVNKAISTHTARHTFATTVTLGNNMPLEVVSKSLGHSSIKMTERYARTTEELIKKNMTRIAERY